MASVGTNFLILFGLTSLLAFIFPLIKDGVFKNLSFKPLITSLLPFIVVLLPFCGLYAMSGAINTPVNIALPAFAGAAILFYVLSRIGLPGQMRGVLLLTATLIFTMTTTTESTNYLVISSVILGLLVAKFTDSLLLGGQQTIDDVLPPLIWLTTVAWGQSLGNETIAHQREAMILGIMSVAQFLHLMQRPFTRDDKIFVKRVVLATSGGLGVLLVVTKLAMDNQMSSLALLCGAGMFATFMFQNMDKEGQSKISGTTAVSLLVVAGLLAMLASRFFGFFGFLALASCAMVSPWFGMTQLAGLFFCVRVLLQLFIGTYNANVTGINIEHTYVGSAQFAGFITVGCVAMLLRDIKNRRMLTSLFLAAATFVPMAANYYLHSEPTSSFLVASVVAGIMFAALIPTFIQQDGYAFENLLLLPAMMTAVGVVSNGLLVAGNEASNQFRAQVLVYIISALITATIIGWLLNKFVLSKKQPPTASAAE